MVNYSEEESRKKQQVTPIDEISSSSPHFRSQRSESNESLKKHSYTSKRSYSDYSSGNEDSDIELKQKTDYTYAKSGSYSSRVTPSRPCESPNMSRTRMTRSYHSSNQSSSSDDDFLLFGKGTFSSQIYANGRSSDRNSSGSFRQSAKTNARDVRYSTVIKHSYGLDSEYSECEEDNLRIRGDFYPESSGFLSTVISSLQRFFIFRWLGVFNHWLWYSSWSNLYKIICHILLLDTWLLSRLTSCKKSKLPVFPLLLLLLFLPLLFLLGNTYLNSENSSVADVLWSTVANILSFVPSWKNINASDLKVFQKTSADGNSWSSVFGQSNNFRHSSESFHDRQDIQNIVRNIFKEEFSGWMEQVTNEQKSFVQKQMEEFSQQSVDIKTLQQQHLQLLSKELTDLKLSIATTSRESKSESDVMDQTMLHSKLEHLEAQLDGMQDILLSLRNCCRNQTDYVKSAERHLATLLIQIMNGTGKSDGPFAAFGDWMRSRFVDHDELKTYLTGMAEHVSSDVSQQTETVARRVFSQSWKEMKNNVTASRSVYVDGVDQICTSEDDVKTIVREAIYLYDADKTGLVDYALESSGGSVISTRCAETYHTGTAQFRLFGIPFWYTSNSPRTVIQPGVHPGQCWAFRGTHGYLVIELSANIRPTAFSVEHIPKSLSPTGSIDSAPKEFSVMGLKKETDLEGIFLGRYTYNADGEPLQYFAVEDPNVESYPIMELRIHSNYGNQDYTCLYRFRVHGTRQ